MSTCLLFVYESVVRYLEGSQDRLGRVVCQLPIVDLLPTNDVCQEVLVEQS